MADAAWTDQMREACRDHCACYGEPPCRQIDTAPPCDDCVNLRPNPDWVTSGSGVNDAPQD